MRKSKILLHILNGIRVMSNFTNHFKYQSKLELGSMTLHKNQAFGIFCNANLKFRINYQKIQMLY